jgi:hypothetical protein
MRMSDRLDHGRDHTLRYLEESDIEELIWIIEESTRLLKGHLMGVDVGVDVERRRRARRGTWA